MRLSDVMSAMGLTVFPIVGLLIFFAVFAAVTVRALWTSRSDAERYASIPLEEGEPREREGRDG